ncbi:flagellar biosynthesis regulator FlaF [Terasakiella sp.]|uniref:flagellar biosynthesis regulator FlaF n=1 Tax=Terasakiella sp. TaxID=2034861 RepID=UPI003AA7D83E
MSQNYGVQGYQTTPMPGDSSASEAWALMQAARRMYDCRDAEDIEDLNEVVRLNWRLWTIFQADLLGVDCKLPLEIRQNMLSLCKFVDERTTKFFSSSDRTLVDVLVNINREIATGLYQQSENKKKTLDDSDAENIPPAGLNNIDV